MYVIDVTPHATPVFDHANTLTAMDETERIMTEYEGLNYEEDMVAS